jgi:hypothetical protein
MPALVNLQEALQTHLLVGDEQILDQLLNPPQGAIHERLAVYANAYDWRLIDALDKEYGLLTKLLGEEAFVELAEAFIDAYPSQSYSIANFSKPLVQFLSEHPPYAQQAYLSEIARLIQALIVSIEAADAAILSHEALQAIPAQNWPSLCFKCHPSVQCFSLAWNSFVIWQALVQEKSVPNPQLEACYCVVWRKGLQSYAITLTEAEAVTLKALQAGACFADICTAVYDKGFTTETQAAAWVANLLARWLNDHLFSEVYIP